MKDKIYYITERNDKLGFKTATLKDCIEYANSKEYIGFDIEASSLDPYRAKLRLSSIGDSNKTFVIDHTTIEPDFIKSITNTGIIGHNLKYDCKVMLNHGIEFTKVYDTMLVEQSIRMGHKGGNSLDVVLARRLNIVDVDKGIRNDFVGSLSFTPQEKHILYSAGDVLRMDLLKEIQKEYLDSFNMNFVMYDIEFPLLLILAKSEYEGIPVSISGIREFVKESKQEQLDVERKMDIEVSKLLKDLKPELLNGKYVNERNRQDVIQTDLFDTRGKVTTNKNKNNINYGSDSQIKELFQTLDFPVPIIKDKKSGLYKPSSGIEALESILKESKGGELTHFIELLLIHRNLTKEITSFGENMIQMINPYSGNLHTIYRQCGADTGRFQSGDTKNKYINSQQIPAKNVLRTCFGTKDDLESKYDIMTMDLSGAELVILADLAGDEVLKANIEDPHSALANIGTNAIINYLLSNYSKSGYKAGDYNKFSDIPEYLIRDNDFVLNRLKTILYTKERVEEAFTNGEFKIDKNTSKDIRNAYKAVTYGLAYGASADRISVVLNIDKLLASVVEEAIKKYIPKTFDFLNKNSTFGLNNGYIVTCNRTNSRRWFKEVYDMLRIGAEVPFNIRGIVERACKNSPIQGTQAFMVKEASVAIMNWVKENNLDVNILMWVHDEWVIRIPKGKKDIAESIKKIATETCNKYLSNGLKMDAEYSINSTWVK